jgi:ankyrin repeat protein
MKKKTIQRVQVVFLIGCLVLGGLSAPSWGAEGGLLDAAGAGDLARVKSLIAAKADVNAKDEYGLTALILASMGGHLDVVRALLAAKADVNAKSNHGGTALILASREGHVDVVRA